METNRSRPLVLTMAAAALLASAACTHRAATLASAASTPPASAAPDIALAASPAGAATLRERMRAIAKTHCGTCHQSTLATAKPAALAIHDLDSPEWPATLTRAQLEGGFTRRLNARLDDEGKSLLRAFVAEEAARR